MTLKKCNSSFLNIVNSLGIKSITELYCSIQINQITHQSQVVEKQRASEIE